VNFDLVRVTWVDAHNNQGAWMNRDELVDFAVDEAYRVTQVGYKVHADELCIVLAARLSTPSADYGQSFGMCERIPKKLIDSEVLIQSAAGGPFRIGWTEGTAANPAAGERTHFTPNGVQVTFADPAEAMTTELTRRIADPGSG
jgi:hypothetical protein